MLELRDYQKEGVSFLVRNKRAILADSMGIGKTAQALRAALEIRPEDVLIICPKSAINVWWDELEKWVPTDYADIYGLYGTKPQRQKVIDASSESLATRFVITTYDILRIEEAWFMNYPWDIIVCDEAHKIRNRKTKIYKVVKRLKANHFFMLTGTPASKGAQDLWALLNVLDRHQFPSFWRFVNAFCYVDDTQFGKQVSGTRNEENLREMLKPYFLRRTKEEVLPELPEKTRQVLTIEQEPSQKKMYNEMRDDMISHMGSGSETRLLAASTVLTQILYMRELLVSPKLLDPEAHYGAAFSALLEHMEGLDDQHVVVFTPFAKALPFLREFLEEEGYLVNTLRGGMSPAMVRDQLEEFEGCLRKNVMLCTIKFAQSFSLSSASTAYFLQYEWNPDENYQAEDRLHRMTSQSAVNIYYFVHQDSVDAAVLAVLEGKQFSVEAIIQDRTKLEAALAGRLP